MIYLYIFCAAILLLLAYMSFEAGFLHVKKVFFTKSSKGLKIAHLTDIHINRLKVSSCRISSVLKKENPDLVIITGDYIEKARDVDDFLFFLKEIKHDFKVVMCLGNHDYKAFGRNKKGLQSFINSIEHTGAAVLHNSCMCVEKNLNKYNIIGIEDLREGQVDIDKALQQCCADAHINIAISHNPDIIFKIPHGKVEYLFCGHFHGGQIWMPFDMEFKILRKDKLCKMGVKRGLHRLNGITLYINKGLGNVAVPLRFLSRPEITIYHMP